MELKEEPKRKPGQVNVKLLFGCTFFNVVDVRQTLQNVYTAATIEANLQGWTWGGWLWAGR